jgi:H/ACA ribonucleoprotein complex subunit 3
MSEHLHKCISCERYTLEEKCPTCNNLAVIPRPPKFSLDDKYAKMRREIKKEELSKKRLY